MSLTLKSTDQDNTPGPGHNSQITPTDWASLLDPEGLNALLRVEHDSLIEKKIVFLDKFEKWKTDTADGLKTADRAARSTDFGKQIKDFAKQVENTREIVKAPFFQADKAVQAFFLGIRDPLNAAVQAIEKRIGEFKVAEAKRLKAIADEEARIKREDAERIAKAAVATGNTDLIEQAQVVDEHARQAEKVAAAPIAAFSQTRGDYSQSSCSIRYTYKVVDLALVPREYFTLDESKVKKAINGKDRLTEIPGLEIEEEYKTTIR